MVPPPFDFNPRSPYGERLAAMGARQLYRRISIHAPLTGSDYSFLWSRLHRRDFNPRSPYGERQHSRRRTHTASRFQSTLPLRGATESTETKTKIQNFNPRSPYGERRLVTRRYCYGTYFNPRSPYGERLSGKISVSTAFQFQSTLPLRGATI